MNRQPRHIYRLAVATVALCSLSFAQGKRPGPGPAYGQITVSTDVHHDRSQLLRGIASSTMPRHGSRLEPKPPSSLRAGSGVGQADSAVPALFNGGTGVGTTLGFFNVEGVGNFFSGPQGGFTPASSPSDATGAVGTTQYLQWVDDAFAIFDKATGSVVYGPVAGNTIWSGFGGACESDNDGQPTVSFDKLANRWVVSQYAISSGVPYLQCVAVSTSADATGSWYRYSFQTAVYDGNSYISKNAKLGVWPDGYYMAFDTYSSGGTFVGDRFCALQRANMLTGVSAGIQCVQMEPDYYGAVVSDLDGPTPPPSGAPAYFAAEDQYVFGIDFWKFHVDWSDSQNSTISFPIALGTGNPTPSCNPASFVGVCVPQPGTSQLLDAYGGRLAGRMPYRNYGDHQALFATETDGSAPSPSNGPAAPTAPRFYEIRVNNGDLYIFQAGTFAPDSTNFRFLPSIASDRAGNIAVAYNLSSTQIPPSQYVATRAASDPLNTLGNETLLNPGNASQTTSAWDVRSALTVDPVDDCTYYYTQQYEPIQGTNNWSTQIENFTLAGCQVSAVTLLTSPAKLMVSENGNPQTAPFSGQFSVGSALSIGTTYIQPGAIGTRYEFVNWSDGGAITHNITVPIAATTYTANFKTQYQIHLPITPAGGGTVSVPSGSWATAGYVYTLTATPAAGYAFASWTGSVANSKSATTTITMNAPQTVTANFVPLATTVTATLTGQTGPSNARVWDFSFKNKGPGQANAVAINTFALTQSAGIACSPTLSTALPETVGNVAPGGTINGSASINFSSCASNARFSLSMKSSENSGASSSTLALSNLSQ